MLGELAIGKRSVETSGILNARFFAAFRELSRFLSAVKPEIRSLQHQR